MPTILLKTGPSLDLATIDCGENAKLFLKLAFDLACFDGDIDMVGMRFANAVHSLVGGVVLGKLLSEEYRANRMEILKSMPEALAAFERAYPGVPLRSSWAKWLEVISGMHKATLPNGSYSDNARVAAAWWDARLIRPGCRHPVCPYDLEGELKRLYERRDEIDAVYADLSDGIAASVDESLAKGKPAIMHTAVDWMSSLAEKASKELEKLGDGRGDIWYLTEEIMKVTPTRVLVTGHDCEWIEVMPGNCLTEITDENIFKACSRDAYGRFIDHMEFVAND